MAFRDSQRLVEALGFHLARTRGSHYIYSHPDVVELINLQEVRGNAKPYQLRQLTRIVVRYDLDLKE